MTLCHKKGDNECGAGVVQGVGYMVAMLSIFLIVVSAVSIGQAKHWAQSAADLSALAGAQSIQAGASVAASCEESRKIAQKNNAVLLECSSPRAGFVHVRTQAKVSLGLIPYVNATALAGKA